MLKNEYDFEILPQNSLDAAPKDKKLLKGFFRKIFYYLHLTYIFITSFLLFLISLFVSFFLITFFIYIIKDVGKNVVFIDTFELPQDFQNHGYSNTAFINKLNDQINFIKNTVRTSLPYKTPTTLTTQKRKEVREIDQKDITPKAIFKFSPTLIERSLISISKSPAFIISDINSVEIKFLNVTFPLNFFVKYLKELFRVNTKRIISEITFNEDQENFKLTTRIIGIPSKPYCGNLSKNLSNLDSILLETAKYIFQHTDPFTLACFLYFNNRLDDSLEVINDYHVYHSKSFDAEYSACIYHLGGIILYSKNKYDDAIDMFNNTIVCNPYFDSAYSYLGSILYIQGKYIDAICNFSKAIDLKPKDASNYNDLALCQSIQENYVEAIDNFKKAIDLDPKLVDAYYSLGLAFYSQPNPNYLEAIDNFNKAIDLNPEYVEAYYNKGLALQDQTQYDDAIKEYKEALKINPQFAPAHHYWGVALCSKGEYTEAFKKFEEVIRIDPLYYRTYEYWGYVLSNSGKFEEAV